jgi:hypothetical protein
MKLLALKSRPQMQKMSFKHLYSLKVIFCSGHL